MPICRTQVFMIEDRGLGFSEQTVSPSLCLWRLSLPCNYIPQVSLISLKKLKSCSLAAAKNDFFRAVTKVAFPVFKVANTHMVTYAFTMYMSWQWKRWPCKKYLEFSSWRNICSKPRQITVTLYCLGSGKLCWKMD